MDDKPHVEEPLHCYNRAALKEALQNYKALEESKVLVSAMSTENNKLLSGGLAQVTFQQESFTSPIGTNGMVPFEVLQKGSYNVDVSFAGYLPGEKKSHGGQILQK